MRVRSFITGLFAFQNMSKDYSKYLSSYKITILTGKFHLRHCSLLVIRVTMLKLACILKTVVQRWTASGSVGTLFYICRAQWVVTPSFLDHRAIDSHCVLSTQCVTSKSSLWLDRTPWQTSWLHMLEAKTQVWCCNFAVTWHCRHFTGEH